MSNKPKRRAPGTARPTPVQLQAATTSWGRRIGVAAGFLAVAGLIAVIALGSDPPSGVPEGTESVAVDVPRHVDGELYADGEVPAGGEHAGIWLNCGSYDTQVQAENVLHSLEHAAVWITYNPDIGQDGIDRLQGLARGRKVIVSPVSGLEDPVLVTAWGQQLRVPSVDDDRIDQFTNEFAGSNNAPEPGGTCGGGVGVPTA